ncbi:MAG: RNA methyltransferase [Planctomycetota bacterium]
MPEFEHIRHRPPTELERERELVLACPAMRSQVNLARIVRMAGCCGVRRILSAGKVKLDPKISRGAEDHLDLKFVRTLLPALRKLRDEESRPLIGLEQTTDSQDIHQFEFPKRCVLVIGHERDGIPPEILEELDVSVEIPVWGLPYSYNAATATAMALYEYCRQHPKG